MWNRQQALTNPCERLIVGRSMSKIHYPRAFKRSIFYVVSALVLLMFGLVWSVVRLGQLHDDLVIYSHNNAGNLNTLTDCYNRDVKPCDLPNQD